MELESECGAIITIENGSNTEIGRELGLGLGPSSSERTVSRHHLSLHLIAPDPDSEIRVGFEVIGKNPIWVCSRIGKGKRIYKKLEKGELGVGDKFSLSLRNPYFFLVKRREGGKEEEEVEKRVLDAVERREKRTLERRKEKEEREKKEVIEGGGDEEEFNGGIGLGLGLEIGSLDASQIDPVKEFGFLVRGHEFDQYPRQKIRAPKTWNWFLEELGEHSDDDETIDAGTSSEGKKSRRRKKKKGGDDVDEDWTGESEEEKVLVVKGGSGKRPKYSTRSKNPKKPRNDAFSGRKPPLRKHVKTHKDEVKQEDEEDEEDETLGGFIVDDEEEEEAEQEESEEELEEEEEEDEDEYDDG